MHLHTHITDCILDYGPVYSFWLYSFERYNGILGIKLNQERIRGRSVQPIELSEPKVRRVRCKNLPYKEGFCRPHKTAIVALA